MDYWSTRMARVQAPTLREFAKKIPADKFAASNLIFFDVETTGLNSEEDEMYQIVAFSSEQNYFNQYIMPRMALGVDEKISFFGGLVSVQNETMEREGQGHVQTLTPEDALENFVKFCESFSTDVILVAHSAQFDMGFLWNALVENSLVKRFGEKCIGFIDTLPAAQKLHPRRSVNPKGPQNHKLATLISHFVGSTNAIDLHDALVDSRHLKSVFERMGRRDQFLDFSFQLEGYFAWQKAKINLPGLQFLQERRVVMKRQLNSLAGKFDVDSLRALARQGRETFVENVGCTGLSSQVIEKIYQKFSSFSSPE
ncbi:DNA polymerase III PolC-type-like [Neocloeon triangulifer]|uniref:DNA polymerase III PolC-type-like n=1 Tax=Neocloeon triangulifer TaxID=2078957 RepID=UPI00286EB648|nr:DNA polymerase III PolC-type-like [Neocloeon triangulifer]XP_059489823.1 DNA polymerase III PolC-type-like [Neocloeon triangulifer]